MDAPQGWGERDMKKRRVMCVYLCLCTCPRVCECVYEHVHARMYVSCVCVHPCVRTCVSTSVPLCTRLRAHIRPMYVRMCVCASECVCVCVCGRGRRGSFLSLSSHSTAFSDWLTQENRCLPGPLFPAPLPTLCSPASSHGPPAPSSALQKGLAAGPWEGQPYAYHCGRWSCLLPPAPPPPQLESNSGEALC